MESVDHPLLTLAAWLSEARTRGEPEPEAMALGTVGADGRPAVRYVLLRGLDHTSLRFFTHYDSKKSQDLRAHGVAAATLFWPGLYRQVRLVGPVEPLAPEESDRYWASRPRGHQLSGAVSPQSSAIANLDGLRAARDRLEADLAGAAVPRPPRWGGWSMTPDEVELWIGGGDRFHDRRAYRLSPEGWSMRRLAP